ncbi:unannotated protein [freshwater metagenome]|uniref:Unannotated protein n=1 Tax=freshwater metagenome TaxID=449393 RepID=A0A6J6AJ32_9ZZZZ
MEDPTASRAAALANATPVALLTNGTVREARGFASKTNNCESLIANWILIKPTTPTALAIFVVASLIVAIALVSSDMDGNTHALSPE